MRPKIAMWSDYGAPRHKHWRSPARRSSLLSIGPKILFVAAIVVAGVIGISGTYPQIIDSEWVQETSPHSQRVAHSKTAPTPRRSGIVAEIPLPPRRPAVITGEAIATPPAAAPVASAEGAAAAALAPAPASPPALSEKRPSVAAAEWPAAELDAALPNANVPEAQATADPSAKPTGRRYPCSQASSTVCREAVVKKRVARSDHHRGYAGAYAQYGGSWSGWSGWSGLGSAYHF
jgi:hypothetical protein